MSASGKVCTSLLLSSTKILFLFRMWFLYSPKLNGICQVVIPTGEDIRKSTAKNPAENAKGKKCFPDKMKIFFSFKIFNEPEPSQNSFSTFACLITTFALNLVHFHPVYIYRVE